MIYLYYFDKPKITEESIAKRTKLRRQRLNMVKEKEKKHKQWVVWSLLQLFKPKQYGQQYAQQIKDARGEINKNRVNSINDKLTKIKKG